MLVAVLLRVMRPEIAIFHHDNAFPTAQAIRILSTGELTFLGSTSDSLLQRHPAGLSYVVMPVWALTKSAAAVAVFIGALNALSVLFVVFTARGLPLMSPIGGLASGALVAVTPYVVEYSRMTWTSAFISLFAALVAWLMFPVWLGTARFPARRTFAAWLVIVAAAMMTQLAILLVGSVGLLSILFWRRTNWPATVIGTLLFTILFGLFVLTIPGSATVRGSAALREAGIYPTAFVGMLRSFSGLGYDASNIVNLPGTFTDPKPPDLVSVGVLFIAGIGIWHSSRSLYSRRALILTVLWLMLPTLALTILAPRSHVYYLLLALPSGFLLFGWGVSYATERSRPLLNSIVLLLLILGGGALIYRNVEHLNALASRPAQSDLWQPLLRDAWTVADTVRPLLDQQMAIQSEMFGTALVAALGDDRRVIWDMMVDPRIAILPPGGLLHVQAVGTGEELKQIPSTEPVTETILQDGTRVLIAAGYRDSPLLSRLTPVDRQTEQGVSLIGVDVRLTNGGRWRLRTAWQIESMEKLPHDAVYGSFAHGFDASGIRVQIIDGPSLAKEWWAAGDIHVHTVFFDADPRLSSLRVGQFDAVTQHTLRFITDEGTSDTVEIWTQTATDAQ